MSIKKLAEELRDSCKPFTGTPFDGWIRVAKHVSVLELKARIEEHEKYFDWECDDCDPEGYAREHIKQLKSQLKELEGK